MARPFASGYSALDRYAKDLKASTLAPRSIAFYCETVHTLLKYMEANNLHTRPDLIDVQDIKTLLDCMARDDLAISTRKGYLFCLKKFLSHFGNRSFDNVSYRLPSDSRPRVDWLSQADAIRLLKMEKTPLQTVVIHFELCLGLRRVEVVRLRCCDIHQDDGYITVHGKGPQGGKPRNVPYARDTYSVIALALSRRTDQVTEALARYPVQTVPDNLLLWSRGGKVYAYSENSCSIEQSVTWPLAKKLGTHFSNHTLRRTFGRMMYRSGVPVPTIAKILGHESTEMTLKYIGVDMDDMRAAMGIDLYGEC